MDPLTSSSSAAGGGSGVKDIKADATLISFNLPYTLLVEPDPDSVIFKSNDAFKDWNNPLGGGDEQPRSRDNTPSLGSIIGTISKESHGGNASMNIDKRSGKFINMTIAGDSQSCTSLKSRILRSFCFLDHCHIAIDTFQVINSDGKFKPQASQELNTIAKQYSVTIFVTNAPDPNLKSPEQSVLTAQSDAATIQMPYHIYIFGTRDGVDLARIRASVLVDTLADAYVECLPLPLSLYPLVAGRSSGNLKKIVEWTKTNIYVSKLTPRIYSSNSKPDTALQLDELFITGLQPQVVIARKLINKLKNNCRVILKEFVTSFVKIDTLLLHSTSELEELMEQNGVFIQFPNLGAARSIIRVQATSNTFLEKVISKVMGLASDLYAATYWVHEDLLDEMGHYLPPAHIPPIGELQKAMGRVASSSRTDVSFARGSFEIVGPRDAVKTALSVIRGLPYWPKLQIQIRFRIELSNIHKEFIAGKKNGKLRRIMKSTKVYIKFAPFNEYNFFVELLSTDYAISLSGLQLLEEELPAETTFYVPECFHKQLIGTMGQMVKPVMRKHNVYIEFFNAPEPESISYSVVRSPNVLIRCPAKNKANIEPAKKDLLDLVARQEEVCSVVVIRITRPHQRLLLTQRTNFVVEVESKSGASMKFPATENDSDLVPLKGIGDAPDQAAQYIKDIIPLDFEIRTNYNPDFFDQVSDSNRDFLWDVVAPLWLEYDIQVQSFGKAKALVGDPRYNRLVLSMSQTSAQHIGDACALVNAFLASRNFDVIFQEFIKRDPIDKSMSRRGQPLPPSLPPQQLGQTPNMQEPGYHHNGGMSSSQLKRGRSPEVYDRAPYRVRDPERDRYERYDYRGGPSYDYRPPPSVRARYASPERYVAMDARGAYPPPPIPSGEDVYYRERMYAPRPPPQHTAADPYGARLPPHHPPSPMRTSSASSGYYRDQYDQHPYDTYPMEYKSEPVGYPGDERPDYGRRGGGGSSSSGGPPWQQQQQQQPPQQQHHHRILPRDEEMRYGGIPPSSQQQQLPSHRSASGGGSPGNGVPAIPYTGYGRESIPPEDERYYRYGSMPQYRRRQD